MVATHIRPTIPEDIPLIAKIEQVAYFEPWSEAILYDCLRVGYAFYSLVMQQQVIGYVIWYPIMDECHLLNITVHPNYQRQGLGQQLLQFVITTVQKQIKLIFLEVRESNWPAIALYEKLGFKQVGLRKNYYATTDGKENAIIYQLNL